MGDAAVAGAVAGAVESIVAPCHMVGEWSAPFTFDHDFL